MINVKSNYSLLSSMLKIDDIINYAIKNHEDSVFLADFNMYGVMYFYKECQKKNLKPIIGLNINLDNIRINIYCKNYQGYKEMIKLSTIQNERVVTLDDLKEFNKELICVVYYESLDSFKELEKIYDDIYLGYCNKEEEKIALTYTKKVVFNRECLYLNSKDKNYLSYLYLIRDGKTISDDIIYDIDNHELNLNDIYNYTDNIGLVNIEEIKESCNIEFPKSELLLPIYKPKNNVSPDKYLFELAKLGLKKRLGEEPNEVYKKRLSYELKIINDMGFCNYFLIVYDFIYYAKKNNILVGPGRGSAAGSLVAYSLGITEIDPIKYDLLFERFLNPERKTMPDIDTDFPDDRREEVIRYVEKKYGKKEVAGIVTFGTMASKLALRDVGRVLNIPIYKIDSLTKLIPNMTRDKLTDMYKNNNNFKIRIDSDNTLKRLYDISCKFEGFPRHTSSHAAGIVMCKCPLDEIIPLTINEDSYLTGYTMEYLEELGLLKMDFLGLKNLSILSRIMDDINNYYDKTIKFNDIPLDDYNVLKIFSDAETTGIFQFESIGMRNFLMKLKPNSFEDIFAAIALYRPGAADSIDTYIRRKHNEEKVVYPDPSLERVLKNTYGIIIYQEQVMAVANIFAGYSLGEADILRRAMSKKKLDVLKNEEEKFIRKSLELGRDKNKAKEIFNLILKFAGYGFNRSHSVAYSIIAYKLAYFKYYYKEVFYSNLLTNVISSSTKTSEYILEAKSKNIKLEEPDINISTNRYLVKDNTIYLPFSVISSIGTTAAENIINARGEEKFTDIYDAISKLIINGLNKKMIESLIYARAFRSFKYNIKTLIENLDNLINYANLTKDLDPSLVITPEITVYREFDRDRLLEEEKNTLGFYLTHHPTTKYLEKEKNIIPLKNIDKYLNKKVNTLILIDKIKTIKTKKGDNMAFITGSDEMKSMDYTLFPNTFNKYKSLKKGDVIKVSGRVEKRLNNTQIIVEDLIVMNGENNEK